VTVPWWQDEPYRPRPPLQEARDVEVCIIGAGIGGLATAWLLADRGVGSVVVEAREVASGASGRNGGFLLAGAAPMYNDARRRFGIPLARRIYAATLSAQSEIYAVAAAIGAERHFRRIGMLRLAVDAVEAAHVRDHAQALAADGFPGELVPNDGIPPLLRGAGRIGLHTAHDGTVQPVHWLRTLAASVVERGVEIFERTPVAAPLGPGAPTVLETPGGQIVARHVVVACDAAIGAIEPVFASRVRSRRLQMLTTAPSSVVALSAPVYARGGHDYYQLLPDGRIALGGFSDLDGADSYTTNEEPSALVQARLDEYLASDLGVQVAVTHRWAGLVGYTTDARPFAGAVPGTPCRYVLGGYNGTGHVNAWVAAGIVADLIAFGSSPDADLFDPGRPG